VKRFTLVLAGLTLAACQETTSPPATPPATSSEVPDLGIAELGPAAATAPQLWATVRFDGILVRGSGAFGSTAHFGPGRYEVKFNVNVRDCVYVATTRPTYSQALLVFTASGHLSVNGVYVETRTQANALVDGNFNLVVTCFFGLQNIRGAVINYAGTLTRASRDTKVTRPGPGRFFVRFSSAVSACSFIATVADPANLRVPFAAGVYTASGPDAFTVYVETRSQTGVLRSGVPFHLAVICPLTPQSRFAVVRAIGSAQRASAATGSIRPSTGRYYVASNRTLTTCTSVATRGSTNTLVPGHPGTVEVLPGTDANNVGFQVRRLQVSGGTLVNLDFHTAILC
jgi:hypothetical protein